MWEFCLELRFRVWHLVAVTAVVSPLSGFGATITITYMMNKLARKITDPVKAART